MKTKALQIFAIAFLGIAVTNCGQSPDPGVPPIAHNPWGNPCVNQPGTVWNGTQCVPGMGGPITPGSFDQYCAQIGGFVASSSWGSTSRRCVRQIGPITTSAQSLSTFSGLYIGAVRAGDRLEYVGQACWVGSGFSWSWTGCPGVNQNGVDKNGTTLALVNGLPQGMAATDGTEVFFLGSSLNRVMPRDGQLRIGINTSSGMQGSMSYQIRISTCIDANGQTITCP